MKWDINLQRVDTESSSGILIESDKGYNVAAVFGRVEDAFLVAAAPDLLETLKQIARLEADKQTGGYELLDKAIKLAKDAIEKRYEIHL